MVNNDKITIYYDKNTGIVCEREPHYIQRTKDSIPLEVSKVDFEKTLVLPYGKCWAYKNNTLQLEEDPYITNSEEYKKKQLENELYSMDSYFNWYATQATQYMSGKLTEDEFAPLKEEYLKKCERAKEIKHSLGMKTNTEILEEKKKVK